MIDYAHIEAWRRLAHRAWFDGQWREIGAEQDRLGLSIAVANGHTGGLLPYFDHFWVEWLPGTDLAVVANLVVTNEAEEKIYLQEYFGEPPDQYQLARFFLMQQVAQIFYGMVFLLLGSSGKPIDWSETGSRIQGLSSTHLGGRDQPGGQPHENVCGRVHWEQFLQNTQQAR